MTIRTPSVAQRLERGDRRRRRLEQGGLGDLEDRGASGRGRPRRAPPRRASTKPGCWISRAETLTQRNRSAGTSALALPAPPACAARLAQDPAADRQDRAVLLGDLDELARARSRPRSGCCQRTSASTPAIRPRLERRRSAGRRAGAGRARRRAGGRRSSSWRSRIAACMPGSKTAKPALPLALAMYIATSALRTRSRAPSTGVAGAGDADARGDDDGAARR